MKCTHIFLLGFAIILIAAGGVCPPAGAMYVNATDTNIPKVSDVLFVSEGPPLLYSQPHACNDIPPDDIIGWAFTHFGLLLQLNASELIRGSLLLLALLDVPIYLTIWSFSKLQTINEWGKQAGIVFGLLMSVIIINMSYLLNLGGIQVNTANPIFYISWLIINNLVLWIGVILLPIYFVYPEMREHNPTRIVAICFILTGNLRYGIEYLISFTLAMEFSCVYHEVGRHYALYKIVMIPVTVGLAVVS